jgi:cytochrome d ubiquinol oxidase subunit II
MEPTLLQTIWFLLIAVLLSVYAVLDGFDFGVGILSLTIKGEENKRILMNSIGPVWDGNEVWLLAGGGSIFAAFPFVYATVFSSFYLAVYLLLLALFFRAISFEFRGRVDSEKWKKFWEYSFGIGSLLPPILLGVAYGNILRGINLNESRIFIGDFFDLLNPYAILIGLLALVMSLMQGAIYLTFKTEEELKTKFESIATKMWIVFVLLYFISTIFTFFEARFHFQGITKVVWFWVVFIVFLVSLIMIPVSLKSKNNKRAFLFSSISIASMIGLSAIGLFPKMVPSKIDLNYSLTVMNSSSTERTLVTMLIIALIGMPLVVIYTVYIYRIFKGKTKLTEESY